MTKKELDRIKKAYSSGLKIQIWFNGYWKDFDVQDYSMYSDPFSKNRQYRIVGNDYADVAEKRIVELEQKLEQTEKDLADYQSNYPTIKELQKELDYQKQARSIAENAVVDLTKENADLKCECRRCVYSDCSCILSDYEKDRNGICDHFKDVFDEVVELRDEQKELLKDVAIYDSMLTKAKTLLQKVADICGYPNYDIPVELYSEIADFIKDSEVEK